MKLWSALLHRSHCVQASRCCSVPTLHTNITVLFWTNTACKRHCTSLYLHRMQYNLSTCKRGHILILRLHSRPVKFAGLWVDADNTWFPGTRGAVASCQVCGFKGVFPVSENSQHIGNVRLCLCQQTKELVRGKGWTVTVVIFEEACAGGTYT